MSHIESEVVRLRALMEKGQFAAALFGTTTLLEEVPENRDAWYIIAVCQRYLQRVPDALATLERFEKIHPDYSRLFQRCFEPWLGPLKSALGDLVPSSNGGRTRTAR